MANTLQYDGSQPTEVVQSLSAEEQDSLAVGEALQQEQQNLLAGKYKSAEELERGYLELQKRMGEGQPNQQESSDVSDQLAKAYESYSSEKKFDASAFENVSKTLSKLSLKIQKRFHRQRIAKDQTWHKSK